MGVYQETAATLFPLFSASSRTSHQAVIFLTNTVPNCCHGYRREEQRSSRSQKMSRRGGCASCDPLETEEEPRQNILTLSPASNSLIFQTGRITAQGSSSCWLSRSSDVVSSAFQINIWTSPLCLVPRSLFLPSHLPESSCPDSSVMKSCVPWPSSVLHAHESTHLLNTCSARAHMQTFALTRTHSRSSFFESRVAH